MPILPKETLPKKKMSKSNIVNSKFVIDGIRVISIFLILFIELLSFILRENESYFSFYYPMLNQLGFFILVFALSFDDRIIKLCPRRKIAIRSLSMYYLFSFFAIIFQISNLVYTLIVVYGLIIVSFVLLLLSLFRNKKI